MGKQSSNITYVSQDQFNKDLDESLNILIEDGADDETIKLYIDDYKSRFAVKKKDGTKPNSTSTSVSTKQDSEQTNGSSGSQEFEYKPVYDERGREVKIKNAKGELVPYMEKVPKGFASSTEEREVVRQEQKQKASKPIVTSSNLKKYQEATKVNDEEKESLQQEVNDEFYKRGFWNGITDGAKKGFNFLTDVVTTIGSFGSETESSIRMETDSFAKEKKQAEQELIASKQPVTPETIAEKAKEIKLKKKVDGLVVDKNNEFLSNLSEEEIKSLNLERVKQYKTLSDKDKYIATQSEILKNNFERDIKDYATAVDIIKKNKEKGIETNQSLIDFAIEKENSLKEKITQVKELEAEYISNKENIGSAEEEVDFLKRNYDTADKIKTLAKIGFGDIYNSLSNKLPLMVDDLDQAIFEPLRPGSSEGVLSDDERQQLIDNSIDWENAKELAKSKVKKDVDFENLSLSNFGQFFAQELGTQISTFAQMAMPGGIVSIGMTSAFDKYGKMEQESNNIAFEFNGKQFNGFEKENGEIVDSLGNTYDPKEVNITSIREADKSTANKFLTSVTFGTAEAVLGAMPTKNIFGRALSSFSTSGERTLFRQSVKEFVKSKGTGILNDTTTEEVSEGATRIIQNIADIFSGNKNISIYDGVDHAAVSAGMLSFFMSASPAVAGLVLKPFSESKENKQVNENLQEIFALQSQLNNPEITSVSKTAIENRISELEKTNSDVLDKIASRTKGISKETFEAIKDTNKKQEILILQASEISKDNSLDKEVKKKIISDLESQFNKLEEKRNKLASGKSTILDALSDSQSVQLREKAANELIAEEKSKGKIDSEINFTEEQINKKAIELYNQSKLNEAKQEATITETKQEAQPQAEVPQQAEAEKVDEPVSVEDIENRRREDIKNRNKNDKNISLSELDRIWTTKRLTDEVYTGITNLLDLFRKDKSKKFVLEGEDGYDKLISLGVTPSRDGYIDYNDAVIGLEKRTNELKKEAKEQVKNEGLKIIPNEARTELDKTRIKEINEKYDAELEALKTKETPKPQAEVKAEVGEVNQKILDLEQQRDTEIEALKEKRLYDTKYIEPIREKYNNLILEEKSKGFDLFHTGNEGLSIESVSVDPRVTRQGKKGKYGGFYTYDNIGNIISFLKGNKTSTVYGIKLNDGVEITDYNGSIERLNAEKLQELRDSGVKVIRGKSIVGKTEIIVVDKSAIKSIEKINETAPSQVDNVDGNVQPGNNVVEPSGTTEQENNQAGDVQAADNGRNIEGENQPKIDTSGIGTENYKQRKSQIKGRKREITIADGSKIKGQYKVVSADDILASHNEENFSKTEGYPVNERGETINDRDYERDKNAQAEVSKIAQDYDGRAIQQTPVVTKEGIVVDGNNRVMSRKLAAKKVTDTKYKEALVNEADMYGINPDEIANVKNPIIVFEAENEMPYNTETLAKFNKQDKKEKSSSGKAVEFSKTLSDRAKRQIAEVYDQAERPSDVTSDVKAVKQLRDILLNNNIIQSNEIPRYFDIDKGVMTKEGVSFMENIALGSVFNEKTINTLSLQGMGDIRNKILQSLVGLINNASLEEKYRLGNEISKAIEVIYQLKTTKQSIEEYLDQPDLYGEKFIPNIDEYATILAISDSGFKKWLQNYNNNVGQPDIFKAEGDGITTKRDKTNETITERKKQVPSNLRSDATINESQNGQADAEVGGEIENKPDDKQDVETLEELGKPEVTPEEKQIQNNKKDEFDNTDLEDDTEVQAQGFFNGSKQNERDLALSDNGPVKLRFPFQKKFKRVWANTFKSNSGLSKESGEVVCSRNRILATYTDHINQEAIAFDKIIKDVKKLFQKEFNQKLIEINNYLSGDKNADISFLNQEQIDKLDYFRERIDSLSKSLIILLEDKMSSMKNKQAIESTKELIETIKQNMGIYITRNYQIFSDDNYRDMITGDFENINKEGQLRIRNAINYLIREEGLTKDEATKSVAEYLAEIRRKKNDFFVQSSGNAVSNFFKKRKGIPKEFRELLGESKDPTYNYINTVYKISQYLGNIEYQYNLREHLINNQIASLEPKLGYEKIVGSSEGWRILNDIYVPVDFKEAFDDMQPLKTVESFFYKQWIKLAGIVKINKTVLSPQTAVRNLYSGVCLGANSGHFFLLKPKAMAIAWNTAWSTKSTQKELFDEKQKLIKLGVLGDGVNSGELMALLNDFSKEVDRMINKGTFEKIFDIAKDFYSFGDDFYKVSGFYIERDRLIKSGMNEVDAEKKAAYRISNGYPTYSYLPKNIQRLRRLPLIGTFVSFPYEYMRSTKNNLYFIKEDLEEGRTKMAYQRAAGMIVANATLGGLNMLTMSMLGLTDDDDNAIRDMLPEWQKNSKFIYLGTKNEKPIFIDGTALFPSEVIFKPISILLEKRKGRELEDKLKIATNEVLSPYISKDISFKTLTEIFENENEFNEKIYLSDNLLEGVFNESEKILNYLMRQAGPGVYNNVTEFLRANEIKPNFFGDKFSAYGKEYTNQEALLGLLGFRISTLNYNAAMSSYAYQVKQSETEDKSSSNKLVKTSKKLTSDEIKGIVEDYAKYHNENYKQMVNIVSSGKKLGMSNMEIKKSLKLSKISDNDIRDLLKGKVPRLSPMSTQTKSNFKQKLKINYKGKDINEILNNFESNFRKMNIEIRQYNRTKIE